VYVSPELLEKIKRIDLLTYLKNYEPQELVHFSGNTYTTRTNDSLKISNGMWNWFSRGIGGKSALDYLIKVRGMSFLDAVEIIRNNLNLIDNFIYHEPIKQKEKKLILPQKSKTNDKVIRYLKSRGIDQAIIQECINDDLIYEDLPKHNIVFVGYDDNNIVKYAMCRATNCSRYMHDISGSSKEYSFKLISKEKSKSVHLFESAIDLLSYATLLKIHGKDYKNYNMISLSGVYQPAKVINESKVPIAIKNYLEKNTNIVTIYLHFDNDFAGKEASRALQMVMSEQYEVIDKPPPKFKDCNDYLCDLLNKK